MKRVPIKGGACKGLTAPFCKIWLWISKHFIFFNFRFEFRAKFKANLDCHAVFVKTARNDGQRKRTLSFYNDGAFLSFWAFARKRKIHLQKRQGIVILSVSEISTLWFYGYFASLSMTRQVSMTNKCLPHWAFAKRRKLTLLERKPTPQRRAPKFKPQKRD